MSATVAAAPSALSALLKQPPLIFHFSIFFGEFVTVCLG
jgi:hypothetical protein